MRARDAYGRRDLRGHQVRHAVLGKGLRQQVPPVVRRGRLAELLGARAAPITRSRRGPVTRPTPRSPSTPQRLIGARFPTPPPTSFSLALRKGRPNMPPRQGRCSGINDVWCTRLDSNQWPLPSEGSYQHGYLPTFSAGFRIVFSLACTKPVRRASKIFESLSSAWV